MAQNNTTPIEPNNEAIRNLTIADLSNLITLIKLYPRSVKEPTQVLPILQVELQKRMDNLFIF